MPTGMQPKAGTCRSSRSAALRLPTLAIVLLLLALVFAIAGQVHSQTASLTAADVILHNGKVVTIDDAFSIAEAVAISGGRITAVGRNADVLPLRGPNTRVMDLAGRTVLPG